VPGLLERAILILVVTSYIHRISHQSNNLLLFLVLSSLITFLLKHLTSFTKYIPWFQAVYWYALIIRGGCWCIAVDLPNIFMACIKAESVLVMRGGLGGRKT